MQAPGQVQRGSGEGSGEGLESLVHAPGQVQRGSGEGSEGSTKGSGEGLGDFGAEPHQVQQGSREGSGGGFGAEPGRDQQGFGKGSEEGPGDFGADPGQVQGFRKRYRKALVQSRATEAIHSYPKDTVFSRRDVLQDNAVVCIKRCRISLSNTSEKYKT